jgi:predicted flap endonuclease-1-like 5' DNA nuclease
MSLHLGAVVLIVSLAALLGLTAMVLARVRRRYRNESIPLEQVEGGEFYGSAPELGDDAQRPRVEAIAPNEPAEANESDEPAELDGWVEELDHGIRELGRLLVELESNAGTSEPTKASERFLAGDDTVLVDLEGIRSIADEVVLSNDQRRAELHKALAGEGEYQDWAQDTPELVSIIEDLADTFEPVPDLPIEPDDLKRIRGIGKVLEGVLNGKGIQSFEQLAALSIDEVEALAKDLKHFGNRVVRDRWVEQAQALVESKTA